MTDASALLPPNASRLQRDVLSANQIDNALNLGIDTLAELKHAPPDAFLDWLIWEYGLDEISPYLMDKRQAITNGLLWQRIRGTPESLKVGLSWIDFDNATLEEFGPGVNSHRFMLESGRIPQSAEILDIIGISSLSAPVANRLWRVWHDYDIRALKLSQHRLGDALLSDASGVRHQGVKWSFADRFSDVATGPSIRVDEAVSHQVTESVMYNPHQMLLGVFKLGDKAIPRSGEGVFDRNSQIVSFDPSVIALDHRRFSYSHMTLSGTKLSSDRSYLGLTQVKTIGEPVRLSVSRLGDLYRLECEPLHVVQRLTYTENGTLDVPFVGDDGYALISAQQVLPTISTIDAFTLTDSQTLSVRNLGLQWLGVWDEREWTSFEHITIGIKHSDYSS
ncbi:phage tail protein [Alteromonas sp. a30]|uniref:phage tail protein n=1 Tax=Alteromonas sp. a30 TaxID=2730917 RepID=UPI002281E0FB|nr:phage tail protein [Alteromonas sp. a30]MCY7295104.1 hypothetical protein [Alteromonas sp. a30]